MVTSKVTEILDFFRSHLGSSFIIQIVLEKMEIFDDNSKILISYCPNKITFSRSVNAYYIKLGLISGKLYHTNKICRTISIFFWN